MHFAEELTGRYRDNRRALPAIAISDVEPFKLRKQLILDTNMYFQDISKHWGSPAICCWD